MARTTPAGISTRSTSATSGRRSSPTSGDCAATGAPHRGERQFWSARGIQLKMERLILPLGADGETADMLLAGLHFEELEIGR